MFLLVEKHLTLTGYVQECNISPKKNSAQLRAGEIVPEGGRGIKHCFLPKGPPKSSGFKIVCSA